MVSALIWDKWKASSVFVATSFLLIVAGPLSVENYLTGFSNSSILSIFLLIIIAYSVNQYFQLTRIFDRIIGKTNSTPSFIFKMSALVASLSSFMNNTPVVTVMMPYVYNWGKKHGVNPSKLLLPLSYAAILGGVITVIGTSTNLVLNGLITDNDLAPLSFLDFLFPGLLVAFGGLLFMYLLGTSLLKGHQDQIEIFQENQREYLVETLVLDNSPIINKTIEEAGLRNLEGVYLTEIFRESQNLGPVSPNEKIFAGDILLFAGETELIFKLIDGKLGLELTTNKQFDLSIENGIEEAIIAQNSKLDRRRAKEIRFREKYDAAIVGIHRNGERLKGKLGSVRLKSGDLVLLSTGNNFRSLNNLNGDLIIVNKIESPKVLSRTKKLIFLLGLALFTSLAAFNSIPLFYALMMICASQFALGMLDLEKVKKNLSLDLLLILISSLAIGNVLVESGAANLLINTVFQEAGQWSNFAVISLLFISTFILTSFVNNIAAIAIVFPFTVSLIELTGIPSNIIFLTAAFGASCCFATPFAYQTNLMVMELGNYKFKDFLILGLPLSLLYFCIFMFYIHFNFGF